MQLKSAYVKEKHNKNFAAEKADEKTFAHNTVVFHEARVILVACTSYHRRFIDIHPLLFAPEFTLSNDTHPHTCVPIVIAVAQTDRVVG
jgi:hypothetical protein